MQRSDVRVSFGKVVLVLAAVLPTLAAAPQASSKPAHGSSQRTVSAVDRAEATRLNNLGAAYLGQQRVAEGARMFERAYALDPHLDVARLNEAIALLNDQQVEPARKILLAFLEKHPDNARAWYNLGLLYKAIGKPGEALDAFQHAARLAPDDADAFYFIGASAVQAGEPKKAIPAFQKALQLNPYHASAEFGLARVYQQSGEQAEARKHLATFQQLTRNKLGAPMSLAYGDQGPLSLAESVQSASRAPEPPIQVSFQPVGLVAASPESSGSPAVCVFDFDGDGRPDIYTGTALYRNEGDGKFTDVTRQAGLEGTRASACAAGDFDNDGHTDLAIAAGDQLVLYRNMGNGTFTDDTAKAGIALHAPVNGLTWFDFDHDGDLDLYVTVASGEVSNVLWRNNGNGTFTNWTSETGLKISGASLGATPTDFNNDRAIDLLVTGADTKLFLNPREGKWPASSMDLPRGTAGAAILDFDKDGAMDIALTLDHAPGIQLLRNVNGKSLVPVKLPELHWTKAWGVAAIDYDNDGWIDLVAAGERSDGKKELRLLRNEGPNGWRDVTHQTGLDAIAVSNPRQVTGFDFDADGDTDLIVSQDSGPPILIRNDGGNHNRSVTLRLQGLNDNKSAVGAKVEVFAGELYQKFEISGTAMFGQSSKSLVVGIGKNHQVDVVRILWPTGVVQDETEFAAGKTAEITEIDRRGSSCPVLFAWDGHRYRFVADMLGAGVLGHWIAPGQRNIPDPTEYIKIDPFAPLARRGILSFRLLEPMEEVVYIDQVRLLAIDHPSAVSVYPNEYFASNPPYPKFKVISARQPRPLVARNDAGQDVTELLSKRDHRYVSDFKRLPFAGFTKPHSLSLDLGEPYAGGPLRLLMTGYIEYFTATSMYAADQAGIQPVAPYVEALTANGKWVRVMDDMGFPAGLPRTITVHLTGKLPPGTRQIRITTNLQIYWDQVLADRSEQLPLVSTPAQSGIMVREVPLRQARLRFHGYPQPRETKSPGDLSYIYDVVSATGPYARERGAYTRPGDVTPLLRQVDDRFAVFGSGEELALDFDSATLPGVPAGWKRDYFFFANGYEKDMDFYAADANTVAPLPFERMGVYPPKTEYPEDPSHLRYLLEYNTRFIGNSEPRSYRFDYRKPR
jgi:Flp pilus assembly protein TadD